MRQGITTKFFGPTNTKGSRIKAIARKRDKWGGEMSLIEPRNYGLETPDDHARVAKLLAAKLGWSGLYICGGKPADDGYMFVNAGDITPTMIAGHTLAKHPLGNEDRDWFYLPPKA
jgi:hypothetical protein